MNIAIIGSNGFIGNHLVNHLCNNKGYSLHLFGLGEINACELDFPYYQLSILTSDELKNIYSEIDLVFYLASSTIPASSWDNPIQELKYNLQPFLNFMEIISNTSVKKIAFISSAGTIYGPSDLKVKEDFDKHPFSPYGIMKLTIEHFLNYYKIKHGISYDIYRISNVYGEGQNIKKGLGVINTFLESIILNNKVSIFGSGDNLRNYIYVKDVVKLIEYSAKSDLSGSNEWNVSSNNTLTVNDIVDILKQIIPEKFEVERWQSRKSDNPKIDIDNSKILEHFPNFEFTDFKDSILRVYNYILSKV